MSDIDTTPPPPDTIMVLMSTMKLGEDRAFVPAKASNIDSKEAFAEGLKLISRGFAPLDEEPRPNVVTFVDQALDKVYRYRIVGAPDDLRALQAFVALYRRVIAEWKKARNVSSEFETKVRTEREERMRQAQKRDSASSRRGMHSNVPESPLTWRQHALLQHGPRMCSLLEYLGGFNEEWFHRLSGLKHNELIDLVDLKASSPNATLAELYELAA